MEASEILELVRAGFSKDEILAMTAAKPDGGEPPKPEVKPPKPEVKPDGGEPPKPEGATNQMVIDALNKLTTTIQANAFFRDGGAGGDHGGKQTAEEILAGMFADPRAKDKK